MSAGFALVDDLYVLGGGGLFCGLVFMAMITYFVNSVVDFIDLPV